MKSGGSKARTAAKPKPEVVDVDIAAVESTLARIEPQIAPADFELVKGLVGTLIFVLNLVRAQRTTLARLRRLFGLASSEKTADVVGQPGTEPGAAQEGSATGPNEATTDGPSQSTSPSPPSPPEPSAGRTPPPAHAAEPEASVKGHGRLPASAYPGAEHIVVAHESLTPGARCPHCDRGRLFELSEPARILRIFGQPALTARCWDCQRLRCSACGDVHTARAPEEAQGPKFHEPAVSMIALCRFGAGLPHNRLARLQSELETPVPASTQWDALDESTPVFKPVFDEMARQAAQGQVVHDDDTYVRILALVGKRRAELLKKGELANPERTGLYTTAIVSLTDGEPIALFYTGRKYAGENLADLLKVRAAELAPPILMSDGLDARNQPKGHAVLPCNCMSHARRGIVDQIVNFPSECRHVLEELRKVFVVEARCKKARLSPEQRLHVHQQESAPVLEALRLWMSEQLDARRVEPSSGLGRAYNYIPKRWEKLTLFLREPGAPLENNICERTLKMAIAHRRNSLFYRTQHGASVGDMFMSLIHTAELRGENPFDFLTELQRHAKAAAEVPADWLPWTYRATLARLAGREADQPTSRAQAPPASPTAATNSDYYAAYELTQ